MGRMGGNQRNYSANPSDYKLLEEVGYGATATVYRAIYLPSNEVVAVKCLDLDRCNSNLVSFMLSLSFSHSLTDSAFFFLEFLFVYCLVSVRFE
jgi:serine/threonine protein kinase